MTKEVLYTQEQLEIELLKHSQGELFRAIERIDKSVSDLEDDVLNGFNKIESKMNSNFVFVIGLIIMSMIVPVILHALKLI